MSLEFNSSSVSFKHCFLKAWANLSLSRIQFTSPVSLSMICISAILLENVYFFYYLRDLIFQVLSCTGFLPPVAISVISSLKTLVVLAWLPDDIPHPACTQTSLYPTLFATFFRLSASSCHLSFSAQDLIFLFCLLSSSSVACSCLFLHVLLFLAARQH